MDDPYYMTPEEELRVELQGAMDRIALLEGQLEDAQLENADLKADLRMVRSGRDTAMRLIRERGLRTQKEAAAFNRKRGAAHG